jgi:hypothetical protein
MCAHADVLNQENYSCTIAINIEMMLFLPFSLSHCAVCPSIYGRWLPLWHPQSLLACNECYLFIIDDFP